MLTLEQLYKLGSDIDIDIFDGITLPDDSPIDRNILINTIMEKCGLNIPMYADPNVMRSAITIWSARNQYTFVHVGKILDAVYSPIENKDYYEDITRTGDNSGDASNTITKTDSDQMQTSKTTTHSGTDTTTDEDTTSAYNVSTYQNNNKSVTELEHGEQISDVGSGTVVKNTNSTNTTHTQGAENETTTSHQHGNIGVSTFFDIQRGEYQLIAEYNPYSFIAGLFENELTLYIY